MMKFAGHVYRNLIVNETGYLKYQTMLSSKSKNIFWEVVMRRNCKCVALCLSIVTLIATFTMDTTAQSVQRRKRKKTPSKATASIKNSSASKDATSGHDIGVEVQSTPFGKVVILTNREKSPITIRKIVINDEWEIKSSALLHSTKSWTSLPVELVLGDTLRVPVSPYKRDVIYVDLYTDKEKLTFKVNK